jgi:hypothetical protein
MQLFCSTRRGIESDPQPPLPMARIFSRLRGFDIWVINSPVTEALGQLRTLLLEQVLISACILSKPPPAGKEWVFFEWFGQLIVGLDLVHQALRDSSDWERTQVDDALKIAIFRPIAAPAADFREQATRYRRLLEDNNEGQIVVRRELALVAENREMLFGQYADPEIGGAIALLSLSGALNSDAEKLVLRTPKSLDLKIDFSEESLAARSVRAAVSVRCYGFSHLSDLTRTEGLKTSHTRWAELYEKSLGSFPAQYFVALELDASVDPTIVIQRGAVFEQQSLVATQTLAATGDSSTIVSAGEVKPLIIPTYCLNSNLAPPCGEPLRPTPFVYGRASGTQQEVWQARQGR